MTDPATARSVSVGPEGLRIAWYDDAGVVVDPKIRRDAEANAAWEKSQAERVLAATELAMRLRKRILDALERRARPHVRVDAYRAGVEEEAEDEAEAPADRSMRS